MAITELAPSLDTINGLFHFFGLGLEGYRGNSKDKIRALALLSQHHGLLDRSWKSRPVDNVLKIKAEYQVQKKIEEFTREVEEEVNGLNQKGLAIYEQAKAKFRHCPDVMSFPI